MSIHLVVVSDQEEVSVDNIFQYLGCIEDYSDLIFDAQVEAITYLALTFKYVKHFRILDQIHQSDRFHVLCLDQIDKNDSDAQYRFSMALRELLTHFMNVGPVMDANSLSSYTLSEGQTSYQLIQWQTDIKFVDNEFTTRRRSLMRAVKDSNNDQIQ